MFISLRFMYYIFSLKKGKKNKFFTEKEHGFTKVVASIIVIVTARVIPWASS